MKRVRKIITHYLDATPIGIEGTVLDIINLREKYEGVNPRLIPKEHQDVDLLYLVEWDNGTIEEVQDWKIRAI